MKHLLKFTIAALTICTPVKLFAQRTIQAIYAEFSTTNDDKDGDTYLKFQVLTANNTWIATREGHFGRFADGTTVSYQMELGSPRYSESLLSGSSYYVGISPNGDDSWHFNWRVIVRYTDGSQSIASGTGGLNESNPNSFRLPLFR